MMGSMHTYHDYFRVELITKFNESRWVEEVVSIATVNVCSSACKISLCILQNSCSKSCIILARFLYDSCMHACIRLCTINILHGCKICKKSCKSVLACKILARLCLHFSCNLQDFWTRIQNFWQDLSDFAVGRPVKVQLQERFLCVCTTLLML